MPNVDGLEATRRLVAMPAAPRVRVTHAVCEFGRARLEPLGDGDLVAAPELVQKVAWTGRGLGESGPLDLARSQSEVLLRVGRRLGAVRLAGG
jgi:hypothetical protein